MMAHYIVSKSLTRSLLSKQLWTNSLTLNKNSGSISSTLTCARFVSGDQRGKPVSYNLEKKVAIVTASTDGIGLSIAKRLAQSGASVVVSSRKKHNVEKAVAGLKQQGLSAVEGTVCHVGQDSDRKALVQFALEKFGGIDILVSNAATNPAVGHILDTEESVFDKIFDINVKAALLLTKEVVPHIEKRGGGSIVYISSIGGYQIMSEISAYSVSKTALIGLSRAVAANVAPMNIRANVVCPGIIKTKFSSAITENEEFQQEFGRLVLMKRIGEPDEIGGVVAFLASDDASYITGESIVPAGGYFSRL